MSESSVTLVLPSDVYVRMMQAFVMRNETLARSYVAGDWNQFNRANALITQELWPLVSSVVENSSACAL